ncbi:eb module containing protein [Dermatophagoides farinae]|uniref:Eb module containing protein n=1 Tax=Dermatophagoides farinae TaxID=6954 RepID=A0A9D4SHH3_DERFA|nr:eb module containing protein [Dermatophagoides farinae]
MTIIGTKSPPKSSIIKQFWQNYSFNNLASLWYSVLITCLQIYIIVRAINRFSGYISLPWPNNDDGGQAPRDSINFYLFFIASSILIIPFL